MRQSYFYYYPASKRSSAYSVAAKHGFPYIRRDVGAYEVVYLNKVPVVMIQFFSDRFRLKNRCMYVGLHPKKRKWVIAIPESQVIADQEEIRGR